MACRRLCLIASLLHFVESIPVITSASSVASSASAVSTASNAPLSPSFIELDARGEIEDIIEKVSTATSLPAVLGAFRAPINEQPLVFPRFKAAAKATSTSSVVTDNGEESETAQLAAALGQLSTDISAASQTVISEQAWVKEVSQVINKYTTKIGLVKEDVTKQQKNIKKMLQTKRKVENMILQNELETKLTEATGDLSTLNSALDQVKTKETKFTRTTGDVQATIDTIKAQLATLRGEPESPDGEESSAGSGDGAGA